MTKKTDEPTEGTTSLEDGPPEAPQWLKEMVGAPQPTPPDTYEIALQLESGHTIVYYNDSHASAAVIALQFQQMLLASKFFVAQCKSNEGAATLVRSDEVTLVDVSRVGRSDKVVIKAQTSGHSRNRTAH